MMNIVDLEDPIQVPYVGQRIYETFNSLHAI